MIKIFVLTSRIIYPWWNYGMASIYFLLENLSKKNIKLYLSFPINDIEENFQSIEQIKHLEISVFPYNHDTKDNILKLIRNLFQKEPYKIQKYWNEKYLNYLMSIIYNIKPDIIQVHTPHMFRYAYEISRVFKIPIILRQQDIVHLQIESFKKETHNEILKAIAKWQLKKTIEYEKHIWNLADRIAFITEQDYRYAIAKFPNIAFKSVYILDGINMKENLYYKNQNKKNAFVFMASDQMPNIISLKWFIKIWKEIFSQYRIDFEFHVFGNICKIFENEKLKLQEYNIYLKGFVKDKNKLDEKIAEYLAFISPTIQGSGYRTKIYDVLSFGMPVICTEFDYKAISSIFERQKDIMIFNDANDLRYIIDNIYYNKLDLYKISKNSYDKCKEKLNIDFESAEFISIYDSLLNKRI